MRKSVFLASVCVLGFQNLALAQTEEPATGATAQPATRSSAAELGQIIVTATRRAQALSEVPIAVSAVTAESLERSGVSDIRQLNQLAPSLLVSSTSSEANTAARIRGIGTVGDNPGLESSVAVFIDGVYRVRNGAGLTELGDLERIEVLRGPQGTLFGRNASAGLINVITKKPSFDFGAGGEVTYGNHDFLRLGGYVTAPIVQDTLAARFDAVYSERDGFLEDPTTGFQMNDRDRYMLRGQLLFTPNDNLEMRLIADYAKTDEHCCGATFQPTVETYVDADGNIATRPNPFVPLLESLGGRYNFNTFDREIAVTPGKETQSPTEDWGISLQADWDMGFANLTSITAYRDYSSLLYGDTDYTNVDILYRDPGSGREFKTFSQELRLQGRAFDNRLDWLVGAYFADESLEMVDRLKFGSDYGQFASCRVVPEALRILGVPGCRVPQTSAILSAVAGAHGGRIIEALDLLGGMNNVGDENSLFKQDSQNWALFTHNVISITDKLSLTLGVRYTEETKKLRATFDNSNTFCPNLKQTLAPVFLDPAANPTAQALAGGIIALGCQGGNTAELNALTLADKTKDSEWTGTGVLSYQFNDDLMAYVSYAKGYKAGGYNLDRSALDTPGATLTASDVENLRFDPEKVDAYEAGFKYTGGSFNLNVAAFRQLFKNFQLNTFNGQFYFVQTVNSCGTDLGGADRDASGATGACNPNDVRAGVVTQGIEVEATAFPSDDITVSAGLTLADTKYRKNLVGGADGVPLDPVLFLLPNQRLSNAPKYVLTGSFAYTPQIGGNGMSALFYADFRYSSDYNTGSDLFPEKMQDGYMVVNARVGLYGEERRWGLELWAQNLLNKDYRQVAFNAPFQGSGSSAQTAAFGTTANQMFTNFLAEPRTYGLTFRVRY
ncbi:TonB-dependent receptor [Pedomonas mirosovicensis]|uniref:TonB-dependent receptor n=1 Tax=Pedomonas mirosovicensis TaxID=2908641 RepID=UPI00216A3BD5|nr:TonB-dependent receptor [Pedomonas mirosovicensis]MCH8683868.1 TonB-dependent receptor [Pedomonas mirosovicensis]